MTLANSRLGQNPVRLIGINAPFEPKLQFGRAFGASNDPRAEVASSWGIQHQGRAQPNEQSIKQPLPAREQTALSYLLSPQLQQQLRGGMKPLQNQGRAAYEGKPIALESVHLGGALSPRHGQHSQQAQRSVAAVPTLQGHMSLRRISSL